MTSHDEIEYTSGVAYWLVGLSLGLMVMGSTVASPLYAAYQQEWGFSSGLLTLVFASYVLALIPTLVVFGNLSDEIGRRRVVIAGLLMIATGSLIFAAAQNVAWLFAARIVQGLAVGAISGAATAALAELQPENDRRAAALLATAALACGTAIGPLFGGVMAEYAPYPLTLSYISHLGLSVLAATAIFFLMPETVEAGKDVRWRPSRPHVPSEIRYTFWAGSAACFCGWAAGGLFLALVPSYAASILNIDNLALGGGVDSLMFASACIAQIVFRKVEPRLAITSGMFSLIPGLLALVVAAPLRSVVSLAIGAILSGAGLGLAFMGGLGLVGRIAPSESRAGTMSSCYVVTYLGLGLPVIGVGFAAGFLGLFHAVLTFAVVISVICLLVASAAFRVRYAGDDARS